MEEENFVCLYDIQTSTGYWSIDYDIKQEMIVFTGKYPSCD